MLNGSLMSISIDPPFASEAHAAATLDALVAGLPGALVLTSSRTLARIAVPSPLPTHSDVDPGLECLTHLLSSRHNGVNIGMLVAHMAGGPPDFQSKAERDALGFLGLRVRPLPGAWNDGDSVTPWLWVSYRSAALVALFAGTRWHSEAGSVGAWVAHLAWLRGAKRGVSMWCGFQTKAVVIPIEHCLPRPTADTEPAEV